MVPDNTWNPKFMLIIAQKNHHTKFSLMESTKNAPAGNLHNSPSHQCAVVIVGSYLGNHIIFSIDVNGSVCGNWWTTNSAIQ
jgi:hypothetical protein